MKKEDIINFLKEMGAKKIKEVNNWIMCSCLFSRDHPKGTDNKPSFGISITNPSYYHCFTCGKKGLLYEIQPLLRRYGLDNLGKAYDIIVRNESFSLNLIQPVIPKIAGMVPYYIYQKYERPNESYLNIPIEMYEIFDIRHDKDYIFIPIFDRFGRLVEVKIRHKINKMFVYPNQNFYHDLERIDGVGAKSAGIWYNMQILPKNNVFLVEGERDVIMLKSIGFDAIASMGASLSLNQIETLKNYNCNYILFFDNDEAGMKAKNKIIKALYNTHNLFEINDYMGCKDPAEVVEKNLIKKVIKRLDKVFLR
jgi:5S rRNA maturation endonuclease (ribonuclease M5)